MSLSPNEKYPGRVAVDPSYQDGKFKDSSPSTANNGSPPSGTVPNLLKE